MNKILVIGLVWAAMTAPAMAEPPTDPFGFRFGSSISNYDCTASAGIGRYQCEARRPYPNIGTYFVFATPNEGICSVSALSTQIPNSQMAKEMANKVTRQLTERFGLSFSASRGTGNNADYVDAKTYPDYFIDVSTVDLSYIVVVTINFKHKRIIMCEAEAEKAEGDAF